MKVKRISLALVVLLAALLLSGCFQIEQEYWINPDGSGKMRMDMAFSKDLMEMGGASSSGLPTSNDLESDFSSSPFVTNMTMDEYEADGYHHTVVILEISDMQAFFHEAQTGADSSDQGLPTLIEMDNGSYRFSQVLSMGGSSQGSDDEMDDFSRQMMVNAFANQYWTVKLHVPNVTLTNGEYNKETGTVEWHIPMGDLMMASAGHEIIAEYRTVPAWRAYVPWVMGGGLCVGFAGLVGLGVIAGVFYMRKKKEA